jgi:hypothetical protein
MIALTYPVTLTIMQLHLAEDSDIDVWRNSG